MRQRIRVPVVYAKFWDHSQGTADINEPILCEIVGWLRNETDVAYNIVTWICNEDLAEQNSEMYCILKSTVIEFKEFKEKPRGFRKRKTAA